MNPEDNISQFREVYDSLRSEIGKVIVGQDAIVDGTLNALFANGHVLLEGVPGLGKTLLVRTLSKVLDLSFNRIQFTPDLMPADVIGTNMVHESVDGKRAFEFHHGPIFAHLILADEINRATPKTQSAMLEAMQERSVTAGGAIITLKLKANQKQAYSFCKDLKYFTMAESLGGIESLICHPTTMTHASVPSHIKKKLGIDEGLIRFSIGCEDFLDLDQDIKQSLNRLK